MKKCGEKISWLTAYDYTTASILDQAGIDTILVGDSASNVMHGNATTLPITVDEMISTRAPWLALQSTPSWCATCPSAATRYQKRTAYAMPYAS